MLQFPLKWVTWGLLYFRCKVRGENCNDTRNDVSPGNFPTGPFRKDVKGYTCRVHGCNHPGTLQMDIFVPIQVLPDTESLTFGSVSLLLVSYFPFLSITLLPLLGMHTARTCLLLPLLLGLKMTLDYERSAIYVAISRFIHWQLLLWPYVCTGPIGIRSCSLSVPALLKRTSTTNAQVARSPPVASPICRDPH